MLFGLASASIDELMDRCEVLTNRRSPESKALRNEIAWRVLEVHETTGGIVQRHGIVYGLDSEQELVRCRTRGRISPGNRNDPEEPGIRVVRDIRRHMTKSLSR